jgi:hypothetical protein
MKPYAPSSPPTVVSQQCPALIPGFLAFLAGGDGAMDSVKFPSELVLKDLSPSLCSGDVEKDSQVALRELPLASLR